MQLQIKILSLCRMGGIFPFFHMFGAKLQCIQSEFIKFLVKLLLESLFFY